MYFPSFNQFYLLTCIFSNWCRNDFSSYFGLLDNETMYSCQWVHIPPNHCYTNTRPNSFITQVTTYESFTSMKTSYIVKHGLKTNGRNAKVCSFDCVGNPLTQIHLNCGICVISAFFSVVFTLLYIAVLEVITVVLQKMQVFWDVMSCSPVSNSILKDYDATILGPHYAEYEDAMIL